MAEEKVGVVLSGGGAKGAGQLGMAKYVYEYGIRPDVVTGVSVGSLNATMWAQEENLELLEKLWREIKGNSDIYRITWWKFWTLYRRLLDNKPLKRKIDHYVDIDKLKNSTIVLKIGVVELQSGEYLVVDKFHPNYKSMLLASTAIPVAFPPVSLNRKKYVDGGARNVAPLKAAIDAGCSTIYLLHCFPMEMDVEHKAFKDVVSVGIRSFLIMYNEVMRTDIKNAERINREIREGRADPQKNYRLINLKVITPTVKEQFGDILDFSPKSIKRDIELGYKIAKKFFTAKD